jgi:hypothetical protein
LNDLVDIPPEKRAMLIKHADRLIEIVLKDLNAWEDMFLAKSIEKSN